MTYTNATQGYTITYCSICGGIINYTLPSNIITSNLKYCNCNQLTGWQCPRCGTVNSPYKTKCDCTPDTIPKISTL